ncbi:2-hexaprenyl-6-methoxy-1,4-benzoquinone methyltransferase [Friedmanniomyces endolithicus]|uniref:2-methoxy-6-polyprenyl-1,4-benzoquinol methylase, mitochondrial n=1 Tax=Friedmanniomyces endolithicus TaxID=329885 RepID=A0AAN6KJJ5_9PEZI|nr:2-hexaprenyl-6-methoxy-1,4-benzoquinone methyltransferase [Friedmanniomyces endolithicus]KAK0805174.1 2-hexaprenyl-6-methoxy-1,4-benzoquinone methyltransferase [Friedmanniomyces endolithicus]KAK0814447.1 2-hexaprenyl-6-methoxy-1,4-benzoquinone methyltransferase [Friedmanniomyces endolithicus]KAK0818403.1 2-hexaprenyl-6-methoxy-1,4-benzoquinone methyltransferase [Friedmanniomyces endolithicus]KAK0856077.1 2-hexaprenyl-6-methoxy-1,4-benzoquinone methyltransferase [Friedmanniomyces endolithicus
MAALLPRATKRLRLSPTSGFVCRDCRRSFASSIRHGQQQQPAPSQHVFQSDKTTHFGFETVAEELKASRVRTVFSSVAANYDTMNDLMSLGIHRLWKDHFVRSLNPGIRLTSTNTSSPHNAAGQTILDIAGGTGDIALRLLDHATTINRDTATSVIISDINPEMLAEGRKRFATSHYYSTTTSSPNRRVSFLEANAEDLSAIESNSIDLYTVAFGIRNFTHKQVALQEAFRVLKPGGVFACLEFTPRLSNPIMNGIYKRWSFGAIPLIGQVVAADRESYQYLVESIERFPSQAEFAGMIEEAGFIVPGKERGDGGELEGGWEDLSLGIAAIHKGVKPV